MKTENFSLMNYLKINRFLILPLAVLTVIFSACGDGECDLILNIPDPSGSAIFNNQLGVIDSYLEQNNLSAQVTDSGLHFIIDNPGDVNMKPTLCDEVNVDYVGYFLDGQEFDSGQGVTFGLTSVINGWSEGIPLFGEGGSGTLIIPSYIGFGETPIPGIPGNSILAFDVTLNSF